MRISYDKKADALYIRFSEEKYFQSEELKEGLIADLNIKGKVIGLEILDASKNLGDLKKKASIVIGGKELKLPAVVEK